MELRATLERGVALLQQGRFDDAEHTLLAATVRWPDAADAWHLFGVAAYGAGRLADAERGLKRAIAIDDQVAAYWINLANLRRATSDLTGAAAALQRALELDPNDVHALCNLGGVLGDQHDFEAAHRAYASAAALDPTLPEAHQGAAWAAATAGDLNAAAAAHQAWAAALPDDSTAQWLAGHTDPTPDALAAYFDRFAPTYDSTLDALDYAVPTILIDLLPTPHADWTVLDAGCGTGRLGPLLRPWAETLVGADLSASMLAEAERTGAYDQLHHGDAYPLLARGTFDLLVAADVFPYMKDPTPWLRHCDWVAFSVELESRGGRIAHPEISTVVRNAGLRVHAERRADLRTEAGHPVPGLIVVART